MSAKMKAAAVEPKALLAACPAPLARTGRRSPERLKVTALAGLMAVGGCSGFGSGWQTSVEDDAMTDRRTSRAQTQLSGDAFNAEVEIACVDGGRARYSLTTFDKAGDGAPLRGNQHYQWGTQYEYWLRQDDMPARRMRASLPQYNNQVVFASERDPGSPATSETLTVRVFLLGGEETFVIDQTDSGVRAVLSACVDTPEQIAAAEAEKQRRNAELDAKWAREDAERRAEQAEYERQEREREAAVEAERAAYEAQQANWTETEAYSGENAM